MTPREDAHEKFAAAVREFNRAQAAEEAAFDAMVEAAVLAHQDGDEKNALLFEEAK